MFKLKFIKNETCEILFDQNIFLKKNITLKLKPIVKKNPTFIFIDKNLFSKMDLKLYCRKLKTELNAEIFLLKGGEHVKSLKTFQKYINKIFNKGVTAKSFIIAIGGGTIIDLAGYIASVIYRGISFLSVPTTLLAAADAAISCKNALNLNNGKNQIGSYQLPKKIFIETRYVFDYLDTRYFWDGFAEIIKHGIGHSKKLLEYLEKNNSSYIKKKIIRNLNKKEKLEFIKDISKILRLSIGSKSILFNKKNNELQRVYHFGHTIGHALEIATKHKVFHGEAITIGMLVAIELSIKILNLDKKVLILSKKLFEKYHLITHIDKDKFHQKLFEKAMVKDKKYFDEKNYFILMNKLFDIKETTDPIDKKDYMKILKKYIY